METRFMAAPDKVESIDKVAGGWKSMNPLGDIVLRALDATGGWSIANMRTPGFRLMDSIMNDPQYRAAAPLPDRAQVVVDKAVVQIGRQRLTFVDDLISRGLVYTLTDPLSVPSLEWLSVNKTANAYRAMVPDTRIENFMPGLTANRLPIYLTLSGFELDIRTLKMSQRLGLPLDTAGISSATRVVNENIEDAGINGATTMDGQDLQVAGYKAPGLLTAPNAETQVLTAAAWSTVPVGATMFAEVELMRAKLVANKKYGPYILYVNTTVSAAMGGDYAATSPNTSTRERLLKIEGIEAIRSADMMPLTKVALVQMTSDVVDVVMGQTPTVIPWTSLNGFVIHNLVMGIVIPRVRSDYDGNSGICIGTLT